MRLRNHLVVGFLTGLSVNGINLLHPAVPTHAQVIGLASVVIGSVAPDVDLTLNGFKKESFKERTMLSHRGLTHHIALPFVLLLIALLQGGLERLMWLQFAVGVFVHILIDMFSPLGIPYSLKYQKRLSIPLYRTGKASEYVFLLGIVVVCLLALGYGGHY